MVVLVMVCGRSLVVLVVDCLRMLLVVVVVVEVAVVSW